MVDYNIENFAIEKIEEAESKHKKPDILENNMV